MRTGAGWLVLAVATWANLGAAQAAENVLPAAITLQPTRQTEGVIRVVVDFARTLLLARPASTLIIGNPAIAQATLSDDRTVILTGRTPGSTNLIVIGTDGAEVSNVILDVVSAGGRLVTVDEGTGKTTYSCSDRCDPVQSGEAPIPQTENTAPLPGEDANSTGNP
ncbi:pilus assembly protein N-terminal domain-containing protein [Sinorhizobium sp. 7-81]|uniref:pilus assembly protein N-terminal domain-containing protein n=1 Tax=Sinorhizobium sp. 8-89 TaxID=3049089 RepID=UPI0024C268C4|nr:pilus assembly protein N-terminal domain-containing protein [Sinorhizobium sp. 8-89]MDK1490884.1 pilus assembly protein N-terminal domain-containing protein [Sinorhizobium sp. 8-89]